MEQVNYYLGIDTPEYLLDYEYVLRLSDICDIINKFRDKPFLMDYVDYLQMSGNSVYAYIANTDEKKFILGFIGKLTRGYLSKRELEQKLSRTDFSFPNCAFGDMLDIFGNYKNLFVLNLEDVRKTKAYLLSLKKDFNDMHSELINCFGNLYFTSNYDYSKFDESDMKELVESLSFLNEQGMSIFIDNNRHSGNALRVISSSFNCSGSNEAARYRKSIDVLGNPYTINCSPHIKIGRLDEDKRIYFAWGNESIAGGRIIIYSIGGHI